MSAVAGFILGAMVCAAVCAIYLVRTRRTQARRVEQLTSYLESASLGRAEVLLPTGEDDLSRLQDEVGKTVMALHHAQAQAVQAQEDYARNLSSIAHQIKTPLAAISLAAQRLDGTDRDAAVRAKRTILFQTERLGSLQDDLLLMAKLDAGALRMTLEQHDVFTLLCIAADNLEELAKDADVTVNVADAGALEVLADEHWMCEALMNVIKNCIEHSPAGGTVRIDYCANPLYTEIEITDEGPGFSPTEEKRLFQRFYAGERAGTKGTGLGLAFARELLELQNGSIEARNRPDGGACFDIRIYCHPAVTLQS